MLVTRFPGNPIITPELSPTIGTNINGPSLIRVPDWLPNPLGRYYLYFAHHQGTFIRLAYADALEGPWRIHEPGTLRLEQTVCQAHVASPDVHVDHADRRLRMYFHGPAAGHQKSFLATSTDGLHFEAGSEVLGPFYFRVFAHDGWHYALAKSDPDTTLLRSRDGLTAFEEGPHLLPRVRHTALRKRGDTLTVVFSRIGDAPEQLLAADIDLRDDWTTWRDTNYRPVLKPELPYEGVGLPLEPSRMGSVHQPVNQLRDPCLHQEDERLWLVYSVAGESGLALAEIEGL